jgi:biopolymer transport protein ExbD
MKKSLFKSRQVSEDMNLQITSMADIFIILLVFLLKSYSTSALAITPSSGLALPQAQGSEQSIDALKIMVSESSVEVEGQPVASLNHFEFLAKDLSQGGASQTLSQALERERKRQLLIARSNSDVQVDSKVIIVADQHVPYSTLKTVLASAALQGYTDFKLAVVQDK